MVVEPDPDFDFGNHVSLVSLHNPDDPRALQELVAAHRTERLNHDHPLWQAIWVRRYGNGSAMLLRSLIHAIADGMRMVQLSMSLFDSSPQGGPIMAPAVKQVAAQPHPPGQPLGRRLRAAAGEVARTAGGAVSRVTGAVADAPHLLARAGQMGRYALRNRWGWATRCSARPRRPVRAWPTTSGRRCPAVGRWSTSSPPRPATSTPCASSRWAPATTSRCGPEPPVRKMRRLVGAALSLAAVKTVAAANHCTVNDVLVATVAGTLHSYLVDHGARCSSVTFMVPVNLKPLDLTLPDTLGNDFALVQLELPTDEPDPLKILSIAGAGWTGSSTATRPRWPSGSRRPSPGSVTICTRRRWICSPTAPSGP